MWKVSATNSSYWHGVPGECFPAALGLVYSNRTCEATTLGKLSRDSQSNNFLSTYCFGDHCLCARGGWPNWSFNLSMLRTAQGSAGNWDPSFGNQVVMKWAAQLKSRKRHTILLPFLLKKQAGLVMRLVIMETKPIPFYSGFCFICKNLYYLFWGSVHKLWGRAAWHLVLYKHPTKRRHFLQRVYEWNKLHL